MPHDIGGGDQPHHTRMPWPDDRCNCGVPARIVYVYDDGREIPDCLAHRVVKDQRGVRPA